jgi:hypothetical protein
MVGPAAAGPTTPQLGTGRWLWAASHHEASTAAVPDPPIALLSAQRMRH